MSENDDLKKRPIRSFVVRSGRMTVGQQKGWDDYWPSMGLQPGMAGLSKDSLSSLFEKEQPLVLEIGFGMGASLFEMAQNQPQMNFLGVEVHRPGVGALLAKAGEARLTNLKVFCCDANEVIKDYIPDASLARVQLYFPDPWHKKRHHKRRLVQAEFVQRIHAKLKAGGCFHMATDWQPYAEHMLAVMEGEDGYRNTAGPGNFATKPDYRPVTKFENRGRKLGHGVWDLLFERIA